MNVCGKGSKIVWKKLLEKGVKLSKKTWLKTSKINWEMKVEKGKGVNFFKRESWHNLSPNMKNKTSLFVV